MKNLQEIIAFFEKGKTPKYEEFRDSWTSFWHKSEKFPITQIVGLQEEIAKATTNFKGYHTTIASLQAAYPQATNKKDFFAWVGSKPTIIWKVNIDGGAWVNTGDEPTEQEIDLAEYLKKQNVTENITDEKETIPSNFAVNTLQSKLYASKNDDSTLFAPINAIKGYVVGTNGQMVASAQSQTTGLLSVVEGGKLRFSGITNVIRFFDANKTLIIELPKETTEYTAPINSAFVASNDTSSSNGFCTILKVQDVEENEGDIPKIYKELGDKLPISFEDKLYHRTNSNESLLFAPKDAIKDHVVNNKGALVSLIGGQTTGLLSIREGGKLRFSGITNVIRFFDANKTLIIELPKETTEYTAPINSAFVASNDVDKNNNFCTISMSQIIFVPIQAIKGYAIGTNGQMVASAQSQTTGLLSVVEGGKLRFSGITNVIRFFDANKTLIIELPKETTEYTAPINSAFVASNDTSSSNGFCTISVGSSSSSKPLGDIPRLDQRIDEISVKTGQKSAKISVNIDDFEGTDIEKINSAIEFVELAGGGEVYISRDVLIDSAILFRSNVHIYFSGTIKQADRVFDNLFRSSGVVVNPNDSAGICLDALPIENIKLLGIGSNARIVGSDLPYRGINPKTGHEVDFIGDWYGWRLVTVLLTNISNYEIGNFFLTKPKSWSVANEWCKDGHIHHIDFDVRGKNNGGVEVRNGCRNLLIEAITGYMLDDPLACTALDNTFLTFDPNNVYPLQTMGFEWKKGDEANIRYITARDFNWETTTGRMRVLATGPKVQHITISNVSNRVGTHTAEVVMIGTGYGSGYVKGNISDIYLNNIVSNTLAKGVICTEASNCWFNNIRGQVQLSDRVENVKVTNN